MTLTLDTLVKVTAPDGRSYHGGTGKWTLGRWRSVKPPLVACKHGLHVCTIAQAVTWLGPRIGLVEVAGERIDERGKSVVERARVTAWLDTWDERAPRLFAADCAERVLPIFERQRPNDDRPRRAIEVARAYARGEVSADEMAAAYAAAYAAAASAAHAAAYAAAYAAERGWQAERLLAYLRGEA